MSTNGNDSSTSSYADNANFWIKIIREQLDKYRIDLTDSAVTSAAKPIEGKSVLDAGCGEGYLSRLLAKNGAGRVSGIDACEGLVEAARSAATTEDLDIDYHVGSVTNLPFEDSTFDLVTCNHLFNDLPEITTPISEFHRVIKSGGRIVILMLHPCFYSAHAERTPANKPLDPNEYFKVRTVTQPFQVAGITSPSATTTWHRPLEENIAALTKEGFLIESISEPHPSDEQLANDPWWKDNFTRPLFLLIVGRLMDTKP